MEIIMSKRIALLSAFAFSLLTTSVLVMPVVAKERTVIVGGAAMYPMCARKLSFP
jgi:hypothetical protein